LPPFPVETPPLSAPFTLTDHLKFLEIIENYENINLCGLYMLIFTISE
jgi:hypothetical protein